MFKKIVTISFCLLFSLFIRTIYSQTFNVQGNISINDTTPVRYAAVTFVDQSDTTKKNSAITDTFGNYRLYISTAVNHHDFTRPTSIDLIQNYPNPFSGTTVISYQLNQPLEVRIKIFNLLGQEVNELKTGPRAIGIYGLKWDGKDKYGKKVSPGIYFYQLQASNKTYVKKMLYGVGETACTGVTNNFSFSRILQSRNENLNRTNSAFVTDGVFTIQITNTDSTEPKIMTKELKGITVQSDTTIDFALEKVKDEILYIRFDLDGSWAKLYVMDIDGTYHKLIADSVSSFGTARWSPDGQWIAYEGPFENYENYQIYIIKADGTEKRVVTLMKMNGNIAPHPSGGTHPVWSPDGKKIAFSRRFYSTEIFVIDIDTTEGVRETRLTANSVPDIIKDWSPDGERIVFSSLDSTGHRYMYSMKPDGICRQKIFTDVFMSDMRFSHGGDRVAFVGSIDDNSGLYIMNNDGTDAQ